MRLSSPNPSLKKAAFTLVELLVSTSLIVLLMLLLLQMTDGASKTWRYTSSKIEQFQGARIGFETMTRRLGQATLNTYWDIDKKLEAKGEVPKSYIRRSELRFLSGPMKDLGAEGGVYPTHGMFFQAPLGFVNDREGYGGLNNLLNTWGYFLQVKKGGAPVPPFLEEIYEPKIRSRLMEFMEPSEKLTVYKYQENRNWFLEPLKSEEPPVRVLAENIIGLILLPKLSPSDEASRAAGAEKLAPKYFYDTMVENADEEINPHNQLPPLVQVVMVALDEPSAARLASKYPDSTDFGLGMDKAFEESERLSATTKDEGDLARLEKKLIAEKLTYRIFTSTVALRAAKWSKENKDQ